MKTKKLLVTALLLALTPYKAFACACCSNDGEYSRTTTKIDSYERDVINDIRFSDKAFLFATEAGYEEDARGINNPQADYQLKSSFANNLWRLIFREGSNSGTLTLPLPLKVEMFKVDIHDGRQSEGGGPLLYKEWRFSGTLNGSGIFKSGIAASARYSLVLQGRGNGCDNAEDFSHWRLEVKGPKSRYAFNGKLGK